MKRRKSFSSLVLGFLLLFGLRLLGGSDPLAALTQRALTVFAQRPTDSALSAPNNPQSDLLAAENERLRQQLALAPSNEYGLVGASVVSKSAGTYRSSLRINAGKEDGIKTDMAVISNGFLVGIVSEVYPQQSVVLLTDDPNFRAAITIGGTSELGIVKNIPSGTIVDRVTQGDVNYSDHVVVTNGLGGLFFPGIPIGRIGEEISQDDDVLRSFVLRTYNLNEDLREVFVVIAYEQ